jgi:hypothetical protein
LYGSSALIPFFAGPPAAIIAIGATITWREIYFDLAAAHFGAARQGFLPMARAAEKALCKIAVA